MLLGVLCGARAADLPCHRLGRLPRPQHRYQACACMQAAARSIATPNVPTACPAPRRDLDHRAEEGHAHAKKWHVHGQAPARQCHQGTRPLRPSPWPRHALINIQPASLFGKSTRGGKNVCACVENCHPHVHVQQRALTRRSQNDAAAAEKVRMPLD